MFINRLKLVFMDYMIFTEWKQMVHNLLIFCENCCNVMFNACLFFLINMVLHNYPVQMITKSTPTTLPNMCNI